MNKYFYRETSTNEDKHFVEDITKENTRYFKDNLEMSIKYGWCDEQGNALPLDYLEDEYGFRNGHYFKYADGMPLALGCSDTYGTGNRVEHLWSNRLGESIGEQVVNLGIPAGSIKSCYRVLKAYTEKYTPPVVFMLMPNLYRSEYILDGRLEKFGPNFNMTKFGRQMYSKIFVEEENLYHETNGFLDGIKAICLEKNIKLIGIPNPSFLIYHKLVGEMGFEVSYDLVHLGPKFHSYVADIFADHFQREDFGITNYPNDKYSLIKSQQ